MLEIAIQWVDLARASVWISLAFYLVFIIGVMCLPITIFPIIGGVLFPFWIAFPLNVLAATMGGWLSCMLTRKLGRDLVSTYLSKRLKSWDALAGAKGFKTVLILRLIGVPPYIVTNYALGFSSVEHSDFFLGTMIGIMPWMGIVTYLANSLWKAVLVGGQEGLAKALAHALAPLLFVSLTILAAVLLSYWLKKRNHSNL